MTAEVVSLSIAQPKPEPRVLALSKGQRTATRILDVAEQCFAESGYAGASLRDIASAAGIQKSSLYNYFRGKDQLYESVLLRGLEPMLKVMAGYLDRREGDVYEPELPGRLLEQLAERPNFARLLQFECLQGGERLKPLLKDWVEQALGEGRSVLERSDGGKHWNVNDYGHLFFHTLSLLLGYFTLAPLYELYTGEKSLSESSLEKEEAMLKKIWHQIWFATP